MTYVTVEPCIKNKDRPQLVPSVVRTCTMGSSRDAPPRSHRACSCRGEGESHGHIGRNTARF